MSEYKHVALCAYGHPSETVTDGKVVCSNPHYGGCPNNEVPPLTVNDWNALQDLITAKLRAAFEAGVLNSTVFKLGDGELLPSELLTKLFDDWRAQQKNEGAE